MTQQVKQTVKNIFTIPKVGKQPTRERRASVFGMVESGKTTILSLLEITCVNYANKTNKKGSKTKFRSFIQERTSGIRQSAGEMRLGMFPEKTPFDHVFEADYLMRWDGLFSKHPVCRLPFGETGGEAFSLLLDRFQDGQYEITPQMQDAHLIHEYILDTDAVVLIAPVPRALGIEKEVGAKLNLPDVNLSRLLSGIYGYKMVDAKENPNHRPLRGIAVFLTKYDAAKLFLKSKQMDLETEEGVHAFMSKYFPETYAVLGWYGLDNVRFWPTGVSIETEMKETTEIDSKGRPVKKRVAKLHPLNPNRGYKIKVNHNRNVPEYTEAPFYEFIEWLKNTVMA